MYAVIRVGGKQQKVKEGETIQVELQEGSPGDEVTFEPILVVEDDGTTHFGKVLGQAEVRARLVGETKGEKIRVFKYKNKTGYKRTTGHRQQLPMLEIAGISLGGPAKEKASAAEKPAAATKAPAAEKAAEKPATAKAEKPAAEKAEKPAKAAKAATEEAPAAEKSTEPPAAADEDAKES